MVNCMIASSLECTIFVPFAGALKVFSIYISTLVVKCSSTLLVSHQKIYLVSKINVIINTSKYLGMYLRTFTHVGAEGGAGARPVPQALLSNFGNLYDSCVTGTWQPSYIRASPVQFTKPETGQTVQLWHWSRRFIPCAELGARFSSNKDVQLQNRCWNCFWKYIWVWIDWEALL